MAWSIVAASGATIASSFLFCDWNLNYLNLSLNQASIYYFILKLWHVKFKLRRFTALRGEVHSNTLFYFKLKFKTLSLMYINLL